MIGELHINADYRPTNVPLKSTPIDTLINTVLNIEDDKNKHKYTNVWGMILLDENTGDFVVNSIMPFDDVDLLEVFIEDEKEYRVDWDVYVDL